MKKGIIFKFIISIVVSALCIMPFSYFVYADETVIDWDTFGVDINRAGAYAYWFKNGLSNISYQEQQTTGVVITTNYGQHNFNVTYEGALSTEQYTLYVYSSNGARMGKYIGYNEKTVSANGNIAYLNSSNVQSYCANCYVGIEIDPNNVKSLTELAYSSTTSGNDTYVNRYQQVIPSLKGTYSHPTTYNNRYKGIAYPNGTYTISFMSNLVLNYITPSITLISDRDISALTVKQVEQTNLSNWDLRTFEITNSGNVALPFDFYIPQFNNKVVEIIPVYQGEKGAMTPELFHLAYNENYIYQTHDAELISIMSSGNNASQSSIDIADNTNSNLSDSGQALESLENQYNDSMSDNLQSINTNLNVNNVSQFVNASNWVKARFDYITQKEAFQLLITYGLILGLALLLLGRYLRG